MDYLLCMHSSWMGVYLDMATIGHIHRLQDIRHGIYNAKSNYACIDIVSYVQSVKLMYRFQF